MTGEEEDGRAGGAIHVIPGTLSDREKLPGAKEKGGWKVEKYFCDSFSPFFGPVCPSHKVGCVLPDWGGWMMDFVETPKAKKHNRRGGIWIAGRSVRTPNRIGCQRGVLH